MKSAWILAAFSAAVVAVVVIMIMGGNGSGEVKANYAVSCGGNYDQFAKSCRPVQCGVFVADDFVSEREIELIRELVDFALKQTGGGSGPPSIVDFKSGAVSSGTKFVNIYKMLESAGMKFSEEGMAVYTRTTERIKLVVRNNTIGHADLEFASPSFISRIDGSKQALTVHDEYWHEHIDTYQYGSFVYTSLLYFSDYGADFQGGRIVFPKLDLRLEPKKGRLVWFTSNKENPHFVEKVTGGVRYAMTTAFTCGKN